METKRYGNWLQIGGNLAVVVGLVFVGYQLYQDRQLKRAELIFAGFETMQNRALALMGENPHEAIVRAAYTPGEASAEDAYIVGLALDTYLLSLDRNAVMENLGVFESGWREGERLGVAYEGGTEIGERFLRSRIPGLRVPEAVRAELLNDLSSAIALKERLEAWRGQRDTAQQ